VWTSHYTSVDSSGKRTVDRMADGTNIILTLGACLWRIDRIAFDDVGCDEQARDEVRQNNTDQTQLNAAELAGQQEALFEVGSSGRLQHHQAPHGEHCRDDVDYHQVQESIVRQQLQKKKKAIELR